MKKYWVWHVTWSEQLIWTGTDEDAKVWRRANLLVEEVTG